MANRFIREPIIGGDDNAWAPYLLALTEAGGFASSFLNVAPDGGYGISIGVGAIGINYGTTKGVAVIDSGIIISLAGLTPSNWCNVVISASGTSVTIEAVSVGSGGDVTSPPYQAYSTSKQGFYDTSGRRIIGMVWIDSGGDAVVFVRPHGIIWSLYAIVYGVFPTSSFIQTGIRNGITIDIGDWNMDTDATKTVGSSSLLPVFDAIKSVNVFVRYDSTTGLGVQAKTIVPLNYTTAGYFIMSPTDGFILGRAGAGYFDNADFNQTSYNRGWITITFKNY